MDRLLCDPGRPTSTRRAYGLLGVERRTWLLAFPAAFVVPVLILSAWLDPTFDWAGRTYRWSGRFDVRVDA